MQILITGVGGFVGRHLAHHLAASQPDAALFGTVIDRPGIVGVPSVEPFVVDLRDPVATLDLFQQVRPDQVYHLAAQASVSRSFEAAWETLENNIRVQLNVIQACLSLEPMPRLLIISSGEIYGAAASDHLPSDENTPLRPSSPYSVSKVTQDMLGLQYYLSHRLPVIRARPFNHLGPGQSLGFVGPDFAMQIARIEAGHQPPRLQVGNLTPRRDFTDVRDVVCAYRLMMNHGQPGEVYNVASGKPYAIQSVLDIFLQHAHIDIEVIPDPARMRPSSVPVLWGDASRLRRATGWEPTIPLEQTLLDVLNDCRQRVQLAI